MTPDLIAGRYRVLRAVGHGGMGTVWLCRDDVLGREVAVKEVGSLPGESAPDAARALREARSSAALNHRNVVSVFDIVDGDDGRVWLVMEYVPSRTLAEIIGEDGPLPPHRAAAIGAQAAAGLAAAHEVGTIHRDVKPGNILVGEGDVAKISDFGIARGAEDEQLTRTGLVTGTPSYFSPELARGEDPAAPSDVYALGATLYSAVEGHPPYPEQRNAIAMLQQIAAHEPPPPERAGPLANPIARMMDRDPRSRWTMADAAQTLRRLTEQTETRGTATLGAVAGGTAPTLDPGAGPAAQADTPGPVAHEESRMVAGGGADRDGREDRDRRRPWLPWLAAMVLLLAALGVGYVLMTDETSPETTEAGAAGSPSPSPSAPPRSTPPPSPSPTPSETPSPTPTQEPETTAPAPAAEEARSTGEVLEQTVRDYFAVMPEDTDAGWQMLASSMKEQGRGSYEAFWDDIEAVDLHRASAIGGNQVDIVLTYFFTDGSAQRERQRVTLQEQGGDYRIADDEVLSSRSVS